MCPALVNLFELGSLGGSVAKGLDRNLKVVSSSLSSSTLNFSVLVRPPVPRLGYQKDLVCVNLSMDLCT